MNWVMPFPYTSISGHYGTVSAYRRLKGMQPHSGTDWAQREGTPIPAISHGTIKLVQWSNILGWVVVQTAWDYAKNKTKYIGYCHLYCNQHGSSCTGTAIGCTNPFPVKVGQKVTAGTAFGIKVSTTGSASTGPHLHATLGDSVKAVFGATRSKQDLYKFILEQQKLGSAPPKARRQVKVCPTCQKPL